MPGLFEQARARVTDPELRAKLLFVHGNARLQLRNLNKARRAFDPQTSSMAFVDALRGVSRFWALPTANYSESIRRKAPPKRHPDRQIAARNQFAPRYP